MGTRRLWLPVDLLPIADSENYDLLIDYIEYDPVVADAEPIRADSGIGELHGVSKWVRSVDEEPCPQPILHSLGQFAPRPPRARRKCDIHRLLKGANGSTFGHIRTGLADPLPKSRRGQGLLVLE